MKIRNTPLNLSEIYFSTVYDPKTSRRTSLTQRNGATSRKIAKTKKKNKFDEHLISTRAGTLRIMNKIDTNTSVVERSYNSHENECIEEDREDFGEPMVIFATFSLLKTLDPESCLSCIQQVPIFLRTLDMDGKLDQSLVSSVCFALNPNDITLFLTNMANEINYYNIVTNCHNLNEIENRMLSLLPIRKVRLWIKSNQTHFIFCNSTKELFPVEKTIVGYCLRKNEDVISSDPGNHPGYYVNNDLNLLLGVKSLMLLPIKNLSGDAVAVLQCCGLIDVEVGDQVPFTKYYIEVLKIIRNMIQKKFLMDIQDYKIPTSFSKVYTNIDYDSMESAVKSFANFIQKTMPCESFEIYKFDDRMKILTRLNDLKTFDESTGGVAYNAAITKNVISIAHEPNNPILKEEIDRQLVNRSIMAKSFFTIHDHFVIVIRGKWNSLVFHECDISFISHVAPLIFDSISIASLVKAKTQSASTMNRISILMQSTYVALSSNVKNGIDPWIAGSKACETFFGTGVFFITTFDGRNMIYHPRKIKWPFDNCISGSAYNYRETTYSSEGGDKLPAELYKTLSVDASHAVAFPFRMNGKVSGAIELINPNSTNIEENEACLFGSLCAILFEKIITGYAEII